MGGTTAKAGAIIDGIAQIANEFEAAGTTHSGRAVKGSGYPVRFPFVDLAEVSAGGGTIAWIDEAGSLRVGPLSAGADPGPACYGKSERADRYRRQRRARPAESTGVTRRRISDRCGARARARSTQLALRSAASVEATAEGIVALIDPQWRKCCGSLPSSAGSIRESSSWWPSAAADRCTPARSPASWGSLARSFRSIPASSRRAACSTRISTQTTCAPCCRPRRRWNTRQSSVGSRSASDAPRHRLSNRVRAARRSPSAASYDARYRGQSFELTIEHDRSPEAIAQRFHAAHRARYGYDVARGSGRAGQCASDGHRRVAVRATPTFQALPVSP